MNRGSKQTLYIFYLVATTLVSFGMAFVWWMSPLGIGFEDPPDEPMKSIVMKVYWASYYIGVPFLFAAQAVSILFAANKQLRWAFAVPAIFIGLFLISAFFIFSQFS